MRSVLAEQWRWPSPPADSPRILYSDQPCSVGSVLRRRYEPTNSSTARPCMKPPHAPASHPALLSPGTQVGPWRVVARAGQGIHGVISRRCASATRTPVPSPSRSPCCPRIHHAWRARGRALPREPPHAYIAGVGVALAKNFLDAPDCPICKVSAPSTGAGARTSGRWMPRCYRVR